MPSQRERLTAEQLQEIAANPDFDPFTHDEDRRALYPEELQQVMEIRQSGPHPLLRPVGAEGGVGDLLQAQVAETTEGLQQVGQEFEPTELIPGLVSTLGAMAFPVRAGISPALARTLGSVGGGGIGEVIKRWITGEEITPGGVAQEALLQGGPTAAVGLAGPIMRSSTRIPTALQKRLPKREFGKRIISAPSEGPTSEAMMRFRLQGGAPGALKAQRTADEIRSGSPLISRRVWEDQIDPITGLPFGSPTQQREAVAQALDLLGDPHHGLASIPSPDIGGASFRDRLRVLLSEITAPAAFALKAGQEGRLDDLVRAVLSGRRSLPESMPDVNTPPPFQVPVETPDAFNTPGPLQTRPRRRALTP